MPQELNSEKEQAVPGHVASTVGLGVFDEDALFADYPPLTPGRITYGTLLAIVKWRERHGIGGDVTASTLNACREEGQTAARAGLELGLIDYGQATGDAGY